jgi:maleylpyruvate isomerase
MAVVSGPAVGQAVGMHRGDIALTLPWMGAGTEFLLRAVEALPDDALADPSRLPGWSRAHVVAHVARNAEALTRLASWARTGVETPMYADAEQRARDIEESATAPSETLRADLVDTAAALDSAVAALDEPAWAATVRTSSGKSVPATEVPWMRVREVWLHAVDLDAGADMADVPPEVLDTMLDDVTAALSDRPDCPAAVLAPTDRERTWSLGPAAGAVELRGAAADLLGWATGRSGADRLDATGPVATPPAWL